MVRAELPGILTADAAIVKTILDIETPRLAATLDTPLEKKLAALFVMGRYEAVIEEGEKKTAKPTAASLQTIGDAARALFDKTPGKKHLENALPYYTAASALVDKEKAPIEWADIQLSAGRMLLDLARYRQAESLLRKVAEIHKREQGENAPAYAAAIDNLAQLLNATNRPDEAEPLMRRALAIGEASFGKDHPNVASSLNNLALLLQDTNRPGEAEPLMRRALAIDEASLGRDHPNIAIRLNNLAILLHTTNRPDEAEPLMRRALAIREASLGKDHPKVASSLGNLARLLHATKRLGEAEPLMRRALAIDEASYGKDHPDVAIDLNNLALLLQDTNRLGEAEPLMRRTVGILLQFTRDTGHSHPHLDGVLGNYCILLMEMGDSKEVAVGKVLAIAKPYGVSF